ncbi:Ig-like domain repeat protein [Paenibacillus alba]|uniref:Ig-like domain-containing protein n=1 Tax=Paenibacillus alba TaxID=1197127 RepID=UPI001564F6A5|nr:Ig-like domain-containing protein [Paenibacillus alba]NQX67800.1 Ig-like domain repeat protein [Paenibacillus alba]
MNKNKVRYRLRWLCLVCFVSLLGSLHQPAYAATTVSNQITGDSASVYGGRVEFTSTVTDASGGGVAPTGNVAFYDGATLIGTGDLVEDEPIVVNKPAGAAPPTQPDLKLTCSNCPVIQWGGLSFWAYSFYENTEEIQLIGYDANNQIVKSWKIAGDRYVEGITIDKSARLITFKGQKGNVISRTWDQLENFSAHASIVVPNLTAGAHSITSSYTGDGSHAAQTASPFIHTVSKIPTATTLSSNNAVANFGEPITFTAYVSSTNGSDLPPIGQITFKANGSVISPPVNLDGNGIATLITASLPVGNLSITAEYSGDANHGASLSTPVTQYVTKAAVQVELTVAPSTNESVYSHLVTFMIQVTNTTPGLPTPEGIVAITGTDSTILWPSGLTLVNGKATWETDQLTVGTHMFMASYAGDANYAAKSSSSYTQHINPIPTRVTMTKSVTEAVYYGTPITFTAHVANRNGEALIPTGKVIFSGGNMPDAEIELDAAGNASLTKADLLPGTVSIQATYVPDPFHQSQISAPLSQVIVPNTQGITLILNHPSSHFQYGDRVLFTASVGGLIGDQGQPGSISLRDNGVEKARVTADVYGAGEIILTGVSSGTHHFTAIYEREGISNGITSQEVVVVVHPVLTQLQLKQGAEEKVLPAIAPWLATVVHGPNDTINLAPTSAEANTSIRIWKQDPHSGVLGAEIGVMNGQSEAIRLTEGLNRLAIKAASSDATVAAETVLSIFYTPDDHPWDMWQVLHVMSLAYNMDGIPTFDKADVNELLKLIEPITRS